MRNAPLHKRLEGAPRTSERRKTAAQEKRHQ